MSARITQETIESIQIPGTANARVTQEALESIQVPVRAATNARITQQTLEGVQIPVRAATNARITQQAIEFMYNLPAIMPAVSNTEWVYSTEIFF